MNLRTTLILALAVVAAVVAVRLMGDPPAPPAPATPLIPAEILDDLTEVEMTLFSGERLKLVREPGGRFHMEFGTAPTGERWVFRDEVDQDLARNLLQAIDQTWRQDFIGDAGADDLLRFQLDPPKYQILVRSSTDEVSIDFGADEPTGHGIMARETGGSGIFKVGRQIANLMELNVANWRDTRLFPFDSQTVTSLEMYVESPRGGEPTILAAERQGSRRWRLLAPREMEADGSRVQGLIHRLCSLRLHAVIAMQLTDAARESSGFPEFRAQITLRSGEFSETLQIGREVNPEDATARLMHRNETMVIAVDAEEVSTILNTPVDSLRPHRLTPVIESAMVALEARNPDGSVRWRAARRGLHPSGEWRAEVPFEGALHTGAGEHSFAQVVADFDRQEYLGFLPPEHPFTPECSVHVEWTSDSLRREAGAELMADGDTTVLRTVGEEVELARAPGRLLEIANLRLEQYRQRQVFPPAAEFRGTIREWELVSPTRRIELRRGANGAVEAVHDPDNLSARLTSALGYLYGLEATDLQFAEDLDEPFRESPLTVRLTAGDVVHELVVGREEAGAFYVRLTPRFEGLVLVIPRGRLQELLDLAR